MAIKGSNLTPEQRRAILDIAVALGTKDALQGLKKRKSKYRNVKVEIDGHKFDSKAEAKRYGQLKLLYQYRVIKDLKLQPPFPIVVNGVKICTYKADFSYILDNKLVVEDVKSPHTAKLPVYKLKKKLVKACYGIDVKEV